MIFLCLLIAAGLRSSLSVMMLPLEDAFGWRRDVISLAAAVGIFIYGLAGPFAAALMERIGLRRTLLGALVLMSGSTALSLLMTEPWHLIATWGVLSGIGSGAVATVLGATIVNRWFKTNRGLMMGLMSASAATGLLVFLPLLAALAQHGGWKPVAIAVSIATAALLPLVYLLVPERPSSIGHARYGADGPEPEAAGRARQFPDADAVDAAQGRRHARVLVSVRHLLRLRLHHQRPGRHASDRLLRRHGHPGGAGGRPARADGRVRPDRHHAVGLADRPLRPAQAARRLLRHARPVADLSAAFRLLGDSLTLFAVLYGLDWIATVPPTLRLSNEAFGDTSGPIVFGWIVAGHQVGAATAAFFGGAMREMQGNYELAFQIAGMTAIIAAALSMLIAKEHPENALRNAQPA